MGRIRKSIIVLFILAVFSLSLFCCTNNSEVDLKFSEQIQTEFFAEQTTEEEFLESIRVILNGKEISLSELKSQGATISGVNLNEIGIHTLKVICCGITIFLPYKIVEGFEATLNGIRYESFLEAFNDSLNYNEKVKIVLYKNVKVEEKALNISENSNIVLDLNGKMLYCISKYLGGSYLLYNKGTLEIIGNGGVLIFKSYYSQDYWEDYGFPGYACNTIRNYGTLTVNGDVVIENQTPRGGASYAIDNYANSTLTIEKGTIKQSGGDIAIRMFSGSAGAPINVTINGGTIVGRRAIWVQLASSNSAVAPTMNLTINGGDFSTTDANQPLIYEYSYGNSHVNTNIVINGGTFNSSSIQLCGGYKGDAPQLTVNGGTFEFDIIKWTADGYEVLYNANK